MKRILLLFAAAALVLGACSKKDKEPAPEKPSFTWEDNESFAQLEIAQDMHSVIDVKAPEGIATFTITFTTIPDGMYFLLNKDISISGNKGNANTPCVFDLISDTSLAAKLSSQGVIRPAGASLANSKTARLDIGQLINDLCDGQNLENDDKFVLDLRLTDNAEGELKKSARFNWTKAPEITFKPDRGNTIYLSQDADFSKDVIEIDAKGRVDKVIICFRGENADPAILSHIQAYTKGDAVVDFVNNEKVAKALGLITGSASDFLGKTSMTIPLESLLLNLSIKATDSHVTEMEIEVTDALGKVTTEKRMLGSPNLGV